MSDLSQVKHSTLAVDDNGIGALRTFSGAASDQTPLLPETGELSLEGVQQMLLDTAPSASTPDASPKGRLGTALSRWEREAIRGMNDTRTIVRVTREGGAESFSCQMLGAHELLGIMLTAPCSDKGALAAVRENENLTFTTIYGTAAVKFTGTIRKLQFQPTPLIYVTPNRVDMREVRARLRVKACIQATIAVADRELPALINDIGVGGLSVAMQKSEHEFATGEQISVSFSLTLLDVSYALKVRATVMTIRGELTRGYPDISVAGVRIDASSDLERLATHAFVQGRLAQDLGAVWRVLFAAR